MLDKNQPIIAISTAPGIGAVGVIRISALLLKQFIPALLSKVLAPRFATLCSLRNKLGATIDHVVAIYYESPNSFTGEDILELQGHGGPVIMSMVIERCLEIARESEADGSNVLSGLRLARPGEFSERAFLNGKIDLTQAESIMDLISASTVRAAKGAMKSLQGEFSKEVNALRDRFIHLRMLVEASIDFPEEDIDFIKATQTTEKISDISKELARIIKNAEQGKLLKSGVNVVIAGQPNAGKSSLLNVLSDNEVAIVTDIAGTTRDVISQTVSIEGVPFHVFDTAGLRDEEYTGNDAVEKIGIERAWDRVKDADILLFMHDLSRMDNKDYVQTENWIRAKIQNMNINTLKVIDVYNKLDLYEPTSIEDNIYAGNEMTIQISAKEGTGVNELKKKLLSLVGMSPDSSEVLYVSRQRHLNALKRVDVNVQEIVKCCARENVQLDIVAEELRLAQNAINEITGEYSNDDLLGEIFSKFCIGK